MTHAIRKLLGAYIPTGIDNPFSLAWKLIKSPDPAARFSLTLALAGIACTPIDLLLQMIEQKRYQRAAAPKRPMVIVVGPPRSGTTLVSQVLIQHLNVSYFNNLTVLFPRAPITANAVFTSILTNQPSGYRSFYGRTDGLSNTNDGLYLWDRWFGADRRQIPIALNEHQQDSLTSFFGAWEEYYRSPLICKINRLDTCAHLVADILNNALFICLRRNPKWLAQSLYHARQEINQDKKKIYGTLYPGRDSHSAVDPVDDVCKQIEFHEKSALEQRDIVGPDRFRIVSYESFCEHPHRLVNQVAEFLNVRIRNLDSLKPFRISNRAKLDAEILSQFEKRLAGEVTDG